MYLRRIPADMILEIENYGQVKLSMNARTLIRLMSILQLQIRNQWEDVLENVKKKYKDFFEKYNLK